MQRRWRDKVTLVRGDEELDRTTQGDIRVLMANISKDEAPKKCGPTGS